MDGSREVQLTLSETFAEADAADSARMAEQRAYLVGALAAVRASSDMRIFVVAIYHHSGAGRWWRVRLGDLCGSKTDSSLRLDPLTERMGCSERQAKRVAGQARQLGLVRTRPAGRDEGEDGRQPGESWEYQIDWLGVRRLIGLEAVDVGRGQAGPGRGQAGPGRGQAGPGRGQAGPGETGPIRNKYPGPVPSRVSKTRDGTGTGAGEKPKLLDGVTLDMLSDDAELLQLLDLICDLSPIRGITGSPADQLWWLSAARCALRTGDNPVRYFRWIVQGNRRGVPKMPDQDAAQRALERLEAELCPG